jgi:hypothetical protein
MARKCFEEIILLLFTHPINPIEYGENINKKYFILFYFTLFYFIKSRLYSNGESNYMLIFYFIKSRLYSNGESNNMLIEEATNNIEPSPFT